MALLIKPNPAKKVEGMPVKVWDPERKGFLAPEGGAVPSNAYWTRRLADGDCVMIGDDAAEAPAEQEKKNTLTKDELVAFLEANKIKVPKKATMSDLADLVEEITKKKGEE